MALVRPAQPIHTIAGSAGGATFRRIHAIPVPAIDGPPLPTPNTAHPQARTSVVLARCGRPSRRTAAQHRAANQARTVAARWRALTPTQQRAWIGKAAALQLTQNPDSIGQWSGWSLWSAVQRRFALAGLDGPDDPDPFTDIRTDRPWVKAFPTTTLGTLRVFLEPVTFPFPPADSVACLYASPPRPATRRASSRREVFVQSFGPADEIAFADAFEVVLADPSRTPPGAIVDLKAATATPAGEATNTWHGRVTFAPDGWTPAGIWWTYSPFGSHNGVELTADRVLHVWDGNYPNGPPDSLDLLHPSEKSIADVLAFMDGAAFTDYRILDATAAARPQSDLPVIPHQRRSHGASVLTLFGRL